MKLLVIGATGRTGRLVLAQAIARRHDVSAFARRPDQLPNEIHAKHQGDAANVADLRPALQGQDAVICAFGGSALARALIGAMRDTGVKRVAMTSSRSVVATKPAWLISLVWLPFRAAYADLARAEGMLEASGLDWTIVRGTMLNDKPPAGRVHIDYAPDATGGDWSLTRADYAMSLLDAVEDPTQVHRALGVGGPKEARK